MTGESPYRKHEGQRRPLLWVPGILFVEVDAYADAPSQGTLRLGPRAGLWWGRVDVSNWKSEVFLVERSGLDDARAIALGLVLPETRIDPARCQLVHRLAREAPLVWAGDAAVGRRGAERVPRSGRTPGVETPAWVRTCTRARPGAARRELAPRRSRPPRRPARAHTIFTAAPRHASTCVNSGRARRQRALIFSTFAARAATFSRKPTPGKDLPVLTAADIEETVYCFFPFREGSWGLSLVDYRLEEGQPLFTVHLVEYEDESFRDIREISLSCDLEGVSRERWVAYLEGWEKAFGSLIERWGHDSELTHLLHCAPVLRDAELVTADDFLRTMQDPRTLEAFHRERHPSLSPSEEEYQEYLKVARPESREAVLQRRRAAYDSAMARHPAVAERIAATYGFVLPRHVALTWAFFSSLSEAEWRGLAMLDLYPGRLGGVLELFKDGGLDRKLKPGFDARMHQVRHEDVPELLLMVQDSQDRYSLFYDDPAHMPSGLVCSPRHGADGWWAETYLDGLRGWLAPIVEDPRDNIEYAAEAKKIVCCTRLLIEALDDFQEWAEQIREEDRAGMLWSCEERTAMAETACGVGIATRQGDASGFELAEAVTTTRSRGRICRRRSRDGSRKPKKRCNTAIRAMRSRSAAISTPPAGKKSKTNSSGSGRQESCWSPPTTRSAGRRWPVVWKSTTHTAR